MSRNDPNHSALQVKIKKYVKKSGPPNGCHVNSVMSGECYVTCTLDSDEIGAHETNVVNLMETTHNMRMVD